MAGLSFSAWPELHRKMAKISLAQKPKQIQKGQNSQKIIETKKKRKLSKNITLEAQAKGYPSTTQWHKEKYPNNALFFVFPSIFHSFLTQFLGEFTKTIIITLEEFRRNLLPRRYPRASITSVCVDGCPVNVFFYFPFRALAFLSVPPKLRTLAFWNFSRGREGGCAGRWGEVKRADQLGDFGDQSALFVALRLLL